MLKNKYRLNSDDIFIRYVLAGLSETLNDKISYKQIQSDSKDEIINIPVLLKATGQERFLRYYFLDKNFELCEEKVEGSYDVVPKGVLNITSTSMNSQINTSPYARGDVFEVDDEGYIKMYNAHIVGLPIDLTVDFEITTNSQGEQYKIWQSLITELYYSEKFSFLYEGAVVNCMISFSDDLSTDKNIEFRTGKDKDRMILKTTLDIETYLPIITDKRFKGQRIKKFINTYNVTNDENDNKETTEKFYEGIIQGTLVYEDDGSPLTGNITLTNVNDEDNSDDKTATLDDGSFIFTNVMARTGYIIKDSNGNVIKRKIHILPNETIDLDLELYR